MPVVPPEKLVKLQQQGEGIRNVSFQPLTAAPVLMSS